MSHKVVDFSDVLLDLNENAHLDASAASFGKKISRHELQCFVAGDLSEKRSREVKCILENNSELQARVDEMRAENLEFKKKISYDDFTAKIQIEFNNSNQEESAGYWVFIWGKLTRWMRKNFAIPSIALASIAVLFIFIGSEKENLLVEKDDFTSSVRNKGGAQISFYIAEEGGVRAGVDGETLYEGARLQFALKDDLRASSMVIVGIDGNDEVSLLAGEEFFREKGMGHSNEKMGESRLLEESLVLDNAVGAERFFVVYSSASLAELEIEVKEAAQELLQAKMDLKNSIFLEVNALSQSSVMIVKKKKVQQ